MDRKRLLPSLLDDVAERVVKQADTAPQGIRAYHGSPHDFDRFDLSKIGTGEGAQAYGHGLYFAGSEPVAMSYRGNAEERYRRLSGHMSPKEEYAFDLATRSGDIRDMDVLSGLAQKYGNNISFDEANELARKAVQNRGRMYEVNIRANPDDFLDWDKPLAQQSDLVRRSITDLAQNAPMPNKSALIKNREAILSGDGSVPGDVLYKNIGGSRLPADTSAALRDAGIPGIKYLDAGSRAAGDGSRNYVVFDDALIDIIRKYGIVPGGLLGAGYAMAPSNAEAAPSRPDWIGNDGAITGNPPWLRPDLNERGTLGKLWDAVTTNPTGTAKAVGGALTDAAKDYAKSVYADPSKGAADALELGVTAMGGAIPQAFWMAGSPDAANAGEDAILAQRRKMMQGLLSDR